MDFLSALILGLIQGVTEFFPVSSSAHLKIAKLLLGISPSENQVVFDLFCHMGTLFPLIYFFRRDLVNLFSKAPLFFAALVPLVPFYFLLKPVRDFLADPLFLGPCLIVTGLLLFAGQRIKIRTEHLWPTKREAFSIGILQAFALIPGISRSGSTIAAGRFFGLTKAQAVNFSFLLSIPAILGGTFLEVIKVSTLPSTLSIDWPLCLVGFAAALIVGSALVSCAIHYLRRGSYTLLSLYCISIGILITLFLL